MVPTYSCRAIRSYTVKKQLHYNTLQRIEKEKKDEYYKSMCRKIMIEDILSNNDNVIKADKLTENKKKLEDQFYDSVKVHNNHKHIIHKHKYICKHIILCYI